ncbi:MAG: Uma2 family endonuclease [Deltaproteobacteria bacterium]|nr:Uma2 family endonuclease [Deltaproteobacteria bacterium]
MPSPTTDIQPRSHVTVEDIFAMEDDKRYEVIGGEIHMVPPPGSSHQELSATLLALLLQHVRAHALGWIVASPVALILAEDDYVEPDIVFVAEARIGIVTTRGIEGVPDLVVEIQSKSPASRRRDQIAKYALYERHGIPHYWIVDPIDRTLVAHTLRDGRYVREASLENQDVFRPALFPGLEIPLASIWPRLGG